MKNNQNKSMQTPEKPTRRGGNRPGAGRKPGTPNKATKALKELAAEFTHEAVDTLVSVMRDPKTPASVRVQAADKLLDRGHGRPVAHAEATQDLMDQEVLDNLKDVLLEKMAASHERQRQVLIRRGIIVEKDQDDKGDGSDER